MTGEIPAPADPVRLYGHQRSGNSYAVALMLAICGTAHEFHHVDLPGGQSREPEHVAINRFGQLPALVHGDLAIGQSTVILRYLANLTGRFGGADAVSAIRIDEWLAFQQDQIFPGIGRTRFFTRFAPAEPPVVDVFRAIGRRALDTLEARFVVAPFLVGEDATIADIACYAYASLAEEGGFDMAEWPQTAAWRRRVEDLSGWNAPAALMPAPA